MRLLSLNLTGGPNNRVGVTVSLSLEKDRRMEPITNHARSWVMIHGAEDLKGRTLWIHAPWVC
jgi:hypothetical protein